jgi:hypothetical protein
MSGMTITLQPEATTGPMTDVMAGPPVFEVRASPAIRVFDPAKMEKALNAILGLDLGEKAERLIRAEIREAVH